MEIKTESKAKPKHRARRPKATANPAASLLAALKFVAVAQKKAGTVQQQFGVISGNWAAASVTGKRDWVESLGAGRCEYALYKAKPVEKERERGE